MNTKFGKFNPLHLGLRLCVMGFAGTLLLAVSSAAYGLDLLQSYRLALEQDARYQVARADMQASRETVPQALAQLLPSVSASLTSSKNQTDSVLPGLGGQLVNNSYEYQGSSYVLNLRQPIYRKYNYAQYEQSKAQVVSAEATLDRNLQDMLVRLCGAYFDALLAYDQKALAVAQKETYATQVQGAKRALEAGQGTRTDVDDAQARYDMTLSVELEALNNVGHTRRQLETIVNQPVEQLARLDPGQLKLSPPLPADPEEWIARGLEANADVRVARANIESVRQEVEKARAGHFPAVDLIASRSKSNNANDVAINQQYLTTSVGLQVSIPIFAGGYFDSQQRQALANLEKYEQQYELARREVSQQIRKEFQNVSEGVLKVRALERSASSVDQAVFSSQKGFQAGTRTRIDILNAEQQRLNVQRDLATARYQYVLARVRLLGLVGSLDESAVAAINAWLQQ